MIRVKDLRRVNQFTFFHSPVLPYPGPETCLVEDSLGWSSEQFTFPKLSLELVAKFRFGKYSGAAKGFHVCSVCVKLVLLAVHSAIV